MVATGSPHLASILVVSRSQAVGALLAFGFLAACVAIGLGLLVPPERSRRIVSWTAIAQVVAAVLWIIEDKPFEGRILISITSAHGLTEGDLVAIAPLVVAWLLRPWRRRGPRHRRGE
jgi:hypothetical protein